MLVAASVTKFGVTRDTDWALELTHFPSPADLAWGESSPSSETTLDTVQLHLQACESVSIFRLVASFPLVPPLCGSETLPFVRQSWASASLAERL